MKEKRRKGSVAGRRSRQIRAWKRVFERRIVTSPITGSSVTHYVPMIVPKRKRSAQRVAARQHGLGSFASVFPQSAFESLRKGGA